MTTAMEVNMNEQTKLGQIRVRKDGNEFVVEEYRWSGWHIIEAVFSWELAKQAAEEYDCEII